MSFDVEEAYRRYGPMVIRRCRQLLGNDPDAIDAAQDVFVQVVVHRETLEMHGSSSLLYRIATNTCLNRLRSRARRPEDLDLLSRIVEVAHPTGDHEAQLHARSFLDRLLGREPPSMAVIAILHLLDGLTLEQVAAEVGLSVSGVRKRLRQLRSKLPDLEEVSA